MAKEATVKDGIFVYIGPSIRGVIQQGSIYRGTRESVLLSLSCALEKHPKIERLVIADRELAAAKQKIKVGGNPLSNAYKVLSGTKN